MSLPPSLPLGFQVRGQKSATNLALETYLFEAGSLVAQADLTFIKLLRKTLNFWLSCLHLLSAEINYRYVPFCWLHVVLGWNPGMQGFQLGRQALYQLNYIPSLSSSICLLTQVLSLSWESFSCCWNAKRWSPS